jgi:tetratricopeptide (TPR) repeat protein
MLVAWTLALALPHVTYAAQVIRNRAPAWRASNALGVSASAIAITMVIATIVQGAFKAHRYAAVWGDHTRLFTQMIVADSASYRGHQLLGREAMRANRRAEAERHLARAYTLYPRDRQTLISYSELLLDEKRPAEAARIAHQLVQQPELRTDRGAVSLYLEATGRAWGPDSVLAAAQRLNLTSPSAASALFIGLAHEARGNPAGALAAYRQGLRLVPTDSALLARAAVLSTRG